MLRGRDARLNAVTALAAFLAVWNNAANLVPGFQRSYVPVNLALTATLVAWARWRGLSWQLLGLSREAVPAGLAWGLGSAALVAAVYAVLLALPRTRHLLRDARVAGQSAGAVALAAFVRIPLGTVLLEEVAFRGLLYGLWQREQSTAAAVLGSSLVFGIWHVVPTRDLLVANAVRARAAALGVLVLAMTAAGAALCLLREVTGGIVAPALVHLATNAFGVAAAFLALRQPGMRRREG